MKILTLIVVIAVFLLSGGPAFSGVSSKTYVPERWGENFDPGKDVAIIHSPHIEDDGEYSYNSSPPTSGPHFEKPVDHKYNTAPIPKGVQVHELEHGSILIQYSCTDCKELVLQLAKVTSEYDLVIMAPYYEMKEKIAITAWGKIDTMHAFDEIRIRRFIINYIYKGNPESQCRNSGTLHGI